MSKHTQHSTYREKLLEHLFIGDLLKLSWTQGDCSLEVGKPEVDNSGYDIIVEDNRVMRHIQLKASYIGGKTSRQKLHVRLSDKPSGCVVWIYFDEKTLKMGPYLFFGGEPGEPLPDISQAKVARHSKGDSDGQKAERPDIREINKGSFTAYKNIEDLYTVLFGHASK